MYLCYHKQRMEFDWKVILSTWKRHIKNIFFWKTREIIYETEICFTWNGSYECQACYQRKLTQFCTHIHVYIFMISPGNMEGKRNKYIKLRGVPYHELL